MDLSKDHIDPDVEAIARQLRQEINSKRRELSPISATSPSLGRDISADLATLQANYDVYNTRFTSHRRVLGRFIILGKKIIREFLNPILVRQVAYNGANARVAAYLSGHLASLADDTRSLDNLTQRYGRLDQDLQQLRWELEALKQAQTPLRLQLDATKQELAASQSQTLENLELVKQEIAAAQNQMLEKHLETFGRQQDYQQRFLTETLQDHAQALQDARQLAEGVGQQSIAALDVIQHRISQTERKVRRLIYASGDGQQSTEKLDSKTDFSVQDVDPDFDYFGFEDCFRGSEDQIKARQKVHIPMFAGHEPVLDVGCGRGEFLELLRESGIKSGGVDLDLDMFLLCRDKGLDVVRADALENLGNRPDDSLGGIFSAQVIEHLEPVDIVRLLKLCHRKLKPGGVLLLETLNPESLMVHYKWFCMDLTHKRLVHPDTLQFLLQSLGYRDMQRKFLSPPDTSVLVPALEFDDRSPSELARFNQAMDRLNHLLYASGDYAMSARK